MFPRMLLCFFAVSFLPVDVFAQEKEQKRRNRNPVPENIADAKTEIYKTVGDVKLKMFIFNPKDYKPGDKRPAIVFFFGGGWRSGSPRSKALSKTSNGSSRRGALAGTASRISRPPSTTFGSAYGRC